MENPQSRQICNSSQDRRVREGVLEVGGDPRRQPRVWSRSERGGGLGAPGALALRTAPQRHKALPPTIPAGSSCVSQAPALRVLPFSFPSAVSLLLERAPLPERGGQMRSLGEKNVSARTIPFSPPAARCSPRLAPFSFALPRAPRLSRPAFPSQQPLRTPPVAIIHRPPGDRR